MKTKNKSTFYLRGHEGLWVECWSNKRLGVVYRESGVSHAEPSAIRDILHPLELAMGVDIGVGAGDPGVGVARLLLHRVHVVVAVLEVAKLILSMELIMKMTFFLFAIKY